MQILVRDKSFYKMLFAIAIPVAGQNLINFAVSMADTVMVGMLGEVELSGVSNANQLGFVFMLLTFGLGSGSNVMISQYWGKGETEPIQRIMTMMYRILIAGSVLFMALALFFPRQVMLVFTPDEEVIAAGVSYLKIIGLSYLFSGIASASVIVFRSVGSVKIALTIYISSLVTNVVMNYLLIFGKYGFPALGVRGAAIATCIARVVEMLILIIYMNRFEQKIRYRLRSFFAQKLEIIRPFMRNAFPVIFNEILWGSGSAMIAVIIGQMGRQFTAANSICTVLSQLVMIAMYGIGNAGAVIVGNNVGAGKYDTVRQYTKTFFALALGLGVIGSGFVLLLKGPLLSLYNISDTAKMYANQIMTIYSVVVIFQALAMIMLIGVLRGGGDTRFVLFADVVFMWLICIPLGALFGLKLGWPVWAVYCVIKSDEALKTVVAIFRIKTDKWINDITKK